LVKRRTRMASATSSALFTLERVLSRMGWIVTDAVSCGNRCTSRSVLGVSPE
jgi:hypothetical protein